MSKQYLFTVEILSKKNKHPLESIAYYAGEKQFDIINSKSYATTTEDKIMWNRIIIPDKKDHPALFNKLPEYLKFRSHKSDIITNARNILWQSVNNREIRPDSQFSRLFELTIPHFLNTDESIALLTHFSNTLVLEGMIVDASLHNHNKTPVLSLFEKMKLVQIPKQETNDISDKLQDNTAFLMCTLRDYNDGRFGNKNRDWNHPLKLKEWRMIWLQLLSESIENCSNVSDEDKISWSARLNMYPDYKKQRSFSI